MNQLDKLKQFTTHPSLILKTAQQPDDAALLTYTVTAHRSGPPDAIADRVLIKIAAAAREANLPELHDSEAGGRYAHNEDPMAAGKLAEGIRAFAVDSIKHDHLIQGLS